ncbi:MAG: hypothetical protein AAGI13_07725 [Pseudomonadota bacterium]
MVALIVDFENVLNSVVSALIVASILGVISLFKAYRDTHRGASREDARSQAVETGLKGGALVDTGQEGPKRYRFRVSTWKLLFRMLFGGAIVAATGLGIDELNIPPPPDPAGIVALVFLIFGGLIIVVNGLRLIYRVAWVIFGGMAKLLV